MEANSYITFVPNQGGLDVTLSDIQKVCTILDGLEMQIIATSFGEGGKFETITSSAAIQQIDKLMKTGGSVGATLIYADTVRNSLISEYKQLLTIELSMFRKSELSWNVMLSTSGYERGSTFSPESQRRYFQQIKSATLGIMEILDVSQVMIEADGTSTVYRYNVGEEFPVDEEWPMNF